MADNDTEKTEDPTPDRRRKAREEGQFPRARDAGNVFGSVAVLLTLYSFGGDQLGLLRAFAVRCYSEPYSLIRGDYMALAGQVSYTVAHLVLPIAVAAALGSLVAGVFEAGFHPNLDLASPKWSRVDPLPRLKQMFMLKDQVVSVGLQLTRVVAVACVVYVSIKDAFPRLVGLGRGDLVGAASALLDAVFRLSLWGSLALFVLTAVDYLNSRRKHEQSIRMTPQEVKDEHRQQEGDPRVRQRQRSRAREMARRGLAKEVRAADFVIVNPTHVSVALRYRMQEGAPVLSAKGYDEVALYIRSIAKEYKIPVIENAPLARALAARVKVGRAIPIDLYAAVAQVLAFVYRLKNRPLDVRRPPQRPR